MALVLQNWKRSVFIPFPKKGSAKECSNYRTIAFISHASKVMLNILQASLQQYVNPELPHVQAGFGKRQRNQRSNCLYLLDHRKSKRVPEKYLTSVQSLSRVRLFATPWITAHQASLSITSSQSSFKLMFIESVMPSSHLIFCCPLLLLPPSIRVFSNESTLRLRWPKYWSFSFSISPSNEHPRLICFRMDWLDLLAVQETLKSLTVQKCQFFSTQPSL